MNYIHTTTYDRLRILDSFIWRDEKFVTTNKGTFHKYTGLCISASINIHVVRDELESHGEIAVFSEIYRYPTNKLNQEAN